MQKEKNHGCEQHSQNSLTAARAKALIRVDTTAPVDLGWAHPRTAGTYAGARASGLPLERCWNFARRDVSREHEVVLAELNPVSANSLIRCGRLERSSPSAAASYTLDERSNSKPAMQHGFTAGFICPGAHAPGVILNANGFLTAIVPTDLGLEVISDGLRTL
jgi:hypothetical protein